MKQDSRWSDEQLTILKGAIADNDLVILAIRKVFLEDELTPNEQKALKSAIQDNEAAQEVIRRHFLPELKVDAPVGQVQDRLATIAVGELSPEIATLHAEATMRAEECIRVHLDELFGGTPSMSFKSLFKLDRDNPEETYVGLLARQKYVIDAEKLTHHLQLLAGRKDETPEQTVERLKKDSAK